MVQKAIVIPVDGEPHVIDYTGGLAQLQQIVGDYVEPVPHGAEFGALAAHSLKVDLYAEAPPNSCVVLLVNEDGLLKRQPVNRPLTHAFGQVIVGPAVIVALD